MADCQCGCGAATRGRRAFVDKAHQLAWMRAGGARELNARLPKEVRHRGGTTAGHMAAASGRLVAASALGVARIRDIMASENAPDRPTAG